MNIFYLHEDISESVKLHLDSHIGKILTEVCQCLSASYRLMSDEKPPDYFFKSTHVNHPINVWLRESYENYMWVVSYGFKLYTEYLHRYGKLDKYLIEQKILFHCLHFPANKLERKGKTPFKMALPDDCRVSDDPVECYRLYYNKHKRHLFYKKDGTPRWTKRQIPDWIEK